MIKVTQTHYTIEAPKELKDLLSKIVIEAAKAKVKNDITTVNQLKAQYDSLVSNWTKEMQKTAKKNSSGWFAEALGGGTFYSVENIDTWKSSLDFFVTIFQARPDLMG